MSDRPMRLKYLTKMKIILCIFLLCITAVSVFGQSVELNSVVGGSVKFPAAVKIEGNLRYSGEVAPIGVVTSGRFTTPRDGRLQWDSSTGLFYLSGLRVEDSGIYTVQDTQQTPVSTFNLTVWEGNVPVSKPQVSFTHDEYPCTILCAAARGTEVTLSWYREGQKKPYGSYPVRSAPDLYLPQTVHKGGIYTCEAKNSVSNEKASITVEAHCTAGPSTGTIVAIIIAVVAVVVTVFTAGFFAYKYRRITRQLQREDMLAVIDKYIKRLRKEEEMQPLRSNGDAMQPVPQSGDAMQPVPQSGDAMQPVPQSDTGSKSQVIHGLASQDTKSELEAVRASFIELIHGLASQDTKSELEDKQPLIKDVWNLLSSLKARKTMTSSPPTGVPLNKATSCEVEE